MSITIDPNYKSPIYNDRLYLGRLKLIKLPKFIENLNNINAFFCHNNELTNLSEISFPKSIIYFNCQVNEITDLSQVKFPEYLECFYCCLNQITSLNNVRFPKSLEKLSIVGNKIDKIENLPLGLQKLHYDHHKIKFIDDVRFDRIKFTLRGYQAIRRIQKRMKRRYKIKNDASKLIGRQVLHWLWSPNGPSVKRMVKKMQADGILSFF